MRNEEKMSEEVYNSSRPYHKNDNRFVEQKNSILMRAYVGYDRLDSGAQCTTLNALYDQFWLCHVIILDKS